jgi:hypothetical protein
MGDLPTLGDWLRLEVPAAGVGLGDSDINGIAFTLFGGRAAYAENGATRNGVDLPWFGHVLPQGAQVAGDEPWDLLTHNDLWAPFEPAFSVLPPLPGTVPAGGGHVEPAFFRQCHHHLYGAGQRAIVLLGVSGPQQSAARSHAAVAHRELGASRVLGCQSDRVGCERHGIAFADGRFARACRLGTPSGTGNQRRRF